MRSVTLTLSEDELLRILSALKEKVGLWAPMRVTDPTFLARYESALQRIAAAYQECFTEENHVGSEDEQEDFGGI